MCHGINASRIQTVAGGNPPPLASSKSPNSTEVWQITRHFSTEVANHPPFLDLSSSSSSTLPAPKMARPAAAAGPPGRMEPDHHDAPMLLRVHVIEARGLPAIYLNGYSDPYVRLQLGRRRPRATTVVKRSLSPVWDEEFGFLVGDVAEELVVSVLNEDRFFGAEFLGRVRLPLTTIMETEDLSLGTKWYQLQPRSGGKFRRKRRDFWPEVAELQGTSGFHIEPWKHENNENCLKRTLTYTKAASKLVKSVKATEEQKYLKATGNSFAVLSSVSTPDVPCDIIYMFPVSMLGSDHGIKAHGDGWLLTIALIEGSGVVGAGTPGMPDPYVIFTCNGKRKTSSVKYQTSEPKWNEIFEFDAMDDPPARLDVVVHDSDGPSNEAPIGQTEVNFVKNNLSDLGDMWLPLDGRIIMAIWKMRSSGLEQKGETIDKESELKELPSEEGARLANDDVKMSEVYSAVLSVDVSALMEMFSGGLLEHKVMERAGCVDYSIQLKYQMTSTPLRPNTCSLKVLLGIAWLKGAKHQKKAAKNVMVNSTNRLREIFGEVEKEIASRKGTLSDTIGSSYE
nr:unnamed protein product [Digitaria exilis]